MTKYIKMTFHQTEYLLGIIHKYFLHSSMAPAHLIVLNLIYDLSSVALPFDNVDADFLKQPRAWTASSITRFMAWFGPTSSLSSTSLLLQ